MRGLFAPLAQAGRLLPPVDLHAPRTCARGHHHRGGWPYVERRWINLGQSPPDIWRGRASRTLPLSARKRDPRDGIIRRDCEGRVSHHGERSLSLCLGIESRHEICKVGVSLPLQPDASARTRSGLRSIRLRRRVNCSRTAEREGKKCLRHDLRRRSSAARFLLDRMPSHCLRSGTFSSLSVASYRQAAGYAGHSFSNGEERVDLRRLACRSVANNIATFVMALQRTITELTHRPDILRDTT